MKLFSELKAFGDAVYHWRADNKVLPWAPMLPYVYPKYWENEVRLFYIGRDTYGWDLGEGGFSDFFSMYDRGDFEGYFEKNNRVLTTKSRLGGWAGFPASFWETINSLHLFIRMNRMPNLRRLTDEETEILDEIGYGNLNSIEIPQTLRKEGYWNDIDKEKYWNIKRASEIFLDKYEWIVDAFNPNVSIITTWSGDEKKYFRNLEYEQIGDETEGKLKIAVYKVAQGDKKSIVVWTYHPSYLPRIRIGQEDFVLKIASVLDKYYQFHK